MKPSQLLRKMKLLCKTNYFGVIFQQRKYDHFYLNIFGSIYFKNFTALILWSLTSCFKMPYHVITVEGLDTNFLKVCTSYAHLKSAQQRHITHIVMRRLKGSNRSLSLQSKHRIPWIDSNLINSGWDRLYIVIQITPLHK